MENVYFSKEGAYVDTIEKYKPGNRRGNQYFRDHT